MLFNFYRMDSFNMKRNIPKLKESVVNKKNKQDSEVSSLYLTINLLYNINI